MMTGIVIASVGLRKIDLVNEGLNALRKKRSKGKNLRDLDQLRQQPDTTGKKLSISKSYKLVAYLLFVTNLFLISAITPEFSPLGDEVGFLLSVGLWIVAGLFYTGLIVSLFRTSKSLAVVLLVTWAAIVLRAV